MLALKQALSLPSLNTPIWNPAHDANLVAWYRYRTGLTFVTPGTPTSLISGWEDASGNGHAMVQATTSEQPTATILTGALDFDSSTDNNLGTALQISLTGAFTIGIRFFPTSTSNVVLADNDESNEFIKITSGTTLRIKNSTGLINLESDTTFGDDYIVITRSDSDAVKLWQNGVATDTGTLAGTCKIDNIGVRFSDLNAYAGIIYEIQIYDTTNTTLTTQVNDRLKLI